MDWGKFQERAYSPRKDAGRVKQLQKLIGYKKQARRNLTRSEKRFQTALIEYFKLKSAPWRVRKKYFQSQKIFTKNGKGYLADFYIPRYKMVFEIDGPSHNTEFAKQYDAVRSSLLATRGIKVIRLNNKQTECAKGLTLIITNTIKTRKTELQERYENKVKQFRNMAQLIIENKTIKRDVAQLTEQYVQQGGLITQCPIVGKNRKIM